MSNILKFTFFLFFSCFMLNTNAQNTVLGTWKTIDDETGIVKSHIEIYKKGDEIFGKVIKVLDPSAPTDPICQNCEGTFKDQPIVGLEIMRNLEQKGNEYKNGKILDPENGKDYDCKIWIDPDNSNKLNVRGYVLFFYRTQIWERL